MREKIEQRKGKFMKKKAMTKFTAVLLTAAMAAGLAACGSSSSEGKTDEAAGTTDSAQTEGESSSDGDVTLTVWNTEVTSTGLQSNDVADYIEQKLGIKLEIIQGDSQKFSVLVAGGDLPDIIYSNYAQQGVDYASLISSGQLIALDDLIDQYGENLKKNFPERLEYSRKFASNGEDKTYFIPVRCYEENPENPDISYSIENVGLMTRWDVYKAIGCPEIKTKDDYLNVLKQMQDYANENDLADGKQVYAFSGWSDWGLWPWWLATVRESGYLDLANNAIVNRETEKVDLNYGTDVFWDSLKFYNKAYNMGILDPEAFTMKNDQFWEKANNGQVLVTYASWQSENVNKTFVANGHPEWGYEKLPNDGFDYISGITTTDAPIGQGIEYATAITTNCKNPEKAMQLIDFCNSDEGARLIYSGVENKEWEMKDGKAVPTDYMKDLVKNDPNYTTTTGATLYNKLCGVMPTQVLSDGSTADVFKSNEEKAANILDIDKDYCDYYAEKLGGEYLYPGMALYDMEQKGMVKNQSNYMLFTNLVQSPSEDTLNIIAQCDQYMNVQGVQAIMASTDEEFDAIRTETLNQLDAMGFQDARKEIIGLYEQAKKDAATFE